MPSIDYNWKYNDIIFVSQNLELLTRTIYERMDEVTPAYTEYGQRLRRVLIQLEAASFNLYSSVRNTYNWNDSLYELFYLEQSVSLAQTTLSGYSNAYRVDGEMAALNFYVAQLLWTYRVRY
jgi:hypothetical protein